MSQSSEGGIFKGALRHAFRQECNLYNRRKSFPLSGKASKMFNMTCNDANADELNAETFEELLPEFDCFIFGADGLLWLRNGVITDAANLVNSLIEKKKEVFILTNDTTSSRDSHVKKLREHRFKNKLSKERIVTPALLAANYIETNKIIDGKGVYLMASGGIQEDLEESGITFFGHGPDPLPVEKSDENELFGIDLSPQPGEVCAVLVGQDKYFNFKKLMKAANFLKNLKCLFLATSDNSVILDENRDVVIPDAGAIAAAVRKASGREPVVLGKPFSHAFEYIKKKWKIDESRTMMICSNIECDVVFGRNHGMRTLLILNKPYEREQLEKMREQQKCIPIMGKNWTTRRLSPHPKLLQYLWNNSGDEGEKDMVDAMEVPLARLGVPEDCAGAVAFLVSDDSKYITGETILISGGIHARL